MGCGYCLGRGESVGHRMQNIEWGAGVGGRLTKPRTMLRESWGLGGFFDGGLELIRGGEKAHCRHASTTEKIYGL